MRLQVVTNEDSTSYIIFPVIEEEIKIIKTIFDCVKSVDASRVLVNLVQIGEDPMKGFAIIYKNGA